MAQVILTIPDAQLPRVINAVCASRYNIDATPIIPTAANAKMVVIMWVKECVKSYETQIAQQALPSVDVSTIVS